MKKCWMERDFTLLWIGQFISQIGDKFYAIALAWWVLERTKSPWMMGMLMTASVLPGLIVGPLAGGCIDRWNRKRILVLTDIIRGVSVFGVAVLAGLGQLRIEYIFGVAVIISVAAAFFNPTVAAVIPQLVPKEQLARANSLSQLIDGVTKVMGPLAGALVVGWLGFTPVFMINGLSFLIAAGLTVLMKRALAPTGPTGRTITADVQSGLRFIVNNNQVRVVLIIIGLAHLNVGGLAVIVPMLAKGLSGSGITNLGLLEMMVGAGMIAGSLLFGLQKRRTVGGHWLFGAMTVMGSSFLIIGAGLGNKVTAVGPFMVLMTLIGGSIAVASIYWTAILQSNVPNEMAGRVFSIAVTLGNTTLPVAYGLYGGLLSFAPIAVVLGTSGVGLILITLLLGVLYRRSSLQGHFVDSSTGS